jgi:hypothetical protein
MFNTVTVSETAIPQSKTNKYDNALRRRKELALELQVAFEKFSRLDSEMVFMHRKSVEDTQKALEEVVRLVEEYKSTLGW